LDQRWLHALAAWSSRRLESFLMMDPFATLGIARAFDVDLKAIERTHRDLSRALHPDRYAAGGASERRGALGKAVEVNEAWRVVRDPIRRAEALFTLAGVPVGETHEPKPSGAFLMDMLEQREALADARAARDADAMRALAGAIEDRLRDAEKALAEGFVQGGVVGEGERSPDVTALAKLVGRLGELRFYKRFLDEVSAIEDEMEDGAHAARDL
jgi:molecular chaperone HscB